MAWMQQMSLSTIVGRSTSSLWRAPRPMAMRLRMPSSSPRSTSRRSRPRPVATLSLAHQHRRNPWVCGGDCGRRGRCLGNGSALLRRAPGCDRRQHRHRQRKLHQQRSADDACPGQRYRGRRRLRLRFCNWYLPGSVRRRRGGGERIQHGCDHRRSDGKRSRRQRSRQGRQRRCGGASFGYRAVRSRTNCYTSVRNSVRRSVPDNGGRVRHSLGCDVLLDDAFLVDAHGPGDGDPH